MQSEHTATLVAATIAPYLPPAHSSQAEVPVPAAYVPAAQSLQSWAVAASKLIVNLPAAQGVQKDEFTAEIEGLYHPLPQSVQFPGPSSALYLPVPHGVQGEPFSP